jgi:tetratricopeptide (TPR) repeat protein
VFCKSGEENKSDVKDILRNIIHQIIRAASNSKAIFSQVVRNARLNAGTPYAQNISELWSMLRQLLGREVRVWCVIDGLDECSNPTEDQLTFLNQLSGVFSTAKAVTRVAVISRLDMAELADSRLWASVQTQSSDVQEDIERFVSAKMQESAVLNRLREKDRLQRRLVESSDGMILWADLMIKELEAGHWDVERVLRHPPRGLGEVYAAIFRRLSKSTAITDVQSILKILLVAARPLRLDELSMGLALLQGLRSHEDYAIRGDPEREGKDILRKTNPLLNVMPNETIQLAHSSLVDFLLKPVERDRGILDFGLENFHFHVPDIHSTVASCLITYLSFKCFRDEAQEEGSHATSFNESSLLDYSTLYLITHSIESPPSMELAGSLTYFFQSTSGWQWLVRLQAVHDISFGHLQIMQSQLNEWSSSPPIEKKCQEILGNFLLYLAQRRYEDNKSFPIEHGRHTAAMSALAHCHREHGKFDQAEVLEVQVMEMRKRMLGEEHPDTLYSMAELAVTFWSQGRWKEAEELAVQVMETRKRVQGEEHPETLTSMHNLALTYSDQGRWQEAEELGMQVMETSSRVLGVKHPSTLTSMANLATTYRDQGRWKEAEELEVQVTETRKRVLGEEHPDTLTSMHNLALTYSDQGRWKLAEELHQQELETCSRVLGEEHPSTLASMANLASTYRDQGRWKEAEELAVQVIETSKRVLGEEHPDTLTSMNNLALTYQDQRRWKEAEELEIQVMETRKKVLGKEHPDILDSMANLALIYSDQGRWKEAEKLGWEAMERRKRVLGEEHPKTLTSITNLASTYRHQGRWTEAEELQRRGLEISSRVLGKEHPETLKSLHNFASILNSKGRNDESLAMMGECVQLRKKILGIDHPYTKLSIAKLEEWSREPGSAAEIGSST